MPHRSRRMVAVLGALAVAAALAPTTAAADDPPEAAQPRPLPDPGSLDTTYEPATDLTTSGRYVLELADEPVAAEMAQEEARGRTLSDATRQQRRDEIRSRQLSVEQAAEARGASVEADYQYAINGVRVEADAELAQELAELPDVVAVHPVELMEPTHADALPLLGVPEVWERVEQTGEGVSVAIIDSGIDYTHAMFGGEGTPEAYDEAFASDTFEPTARVVGGWDFVGDDYNAADPDNDVPQPDENPIDCGGHGTHVAGTTGGNGVLADGSTFEGPYDADTLDAHDFEIAPGVAPAVDLYALKVFGCEGSTAVTVDAIEWAVERDLDVINMSLGSVFGRPDGATTVAADNAAEAGVLVVASAGNSGPIPYIGGSPASSTRTISVAANDAIAQLPFATLTLDGDAQVQAIVANEAEVPDDAVWDVHVLGGDPAAPSLGCDEEQWQAEAAAVEGAIVITERGVCARVDRAILGEQAGAAAVVMIDDSPNLPPIEGPIRHPETGDIVQIPFLGVRGGDGPEVAAAGVIAAEGYVGDNPNHTGLSSFTSAGPRGGDGALKPDVTAPGVGVLSADAGTGSAGTRESGTSMSAPVVAGVAAIAVQSKPDWEHDDLRAAITSTSQAPLVVGETPFLVRRAGAGMVQADAVLDATTVAHGDEGTSTLSFGVVDVISTWTDEREITLDNLGDEDVAYDVSAGATGGSQPHGVTTDVDTVTVPAGGSATVTMTVDVAAEDLDAGELGLDFTDVSGVVEFSPSAGPDVALTVPYLAVAAPRADVDIERQGRFTPQPGVTPVEVTNDSSQLATVHPFSWGMSAPDTGLADNDLQAVGVRADEVPLGLGMVDTLEFAVSMHRPWSNASALEVQVPVDTTGDGEADYVVIGVDFGLLTAGAFSGEVAAAILDLDDGSLSAYFYAVAPEDNHTMVLPVPQSALGLGDGNRVVRYSAAAIDLLSGEADAIDGWAGFDTTRPSVDAPVTAVPPGATVTIDVTTDGRPVRGARAEGVLFVVPQAPTGEQAVTFTNPTRGP